MDRNDYVAIQANALVRANQGSLTLTQKRILLYVISKIKPDDEDFKYYRINVSEFASLLPNKGSNETLSCMSAMDGLESKKLKIDFGSHTTSTRLALKSKYYVGEGYFEVLLDDELKPLLLSLREQFSEVYIRHALQLTSTHAVRLYEILKSWQSTGLLITSPDELRDMLGIPDKYKVFSQFKAKCLKPAFDQINNTTDLNIIEMKEERFGKRVTKISIKFKISKDYIHFKKQKEEVLNTPLEKELNSRGIININQYDIPDSIWKEALNEESKDAPPSHLVTTAKKLNSQLLTSKSDISLPDYSKINIKYWEDNSNKYSGLMASTSYLQSSNGEVITWSEDGFLNKIKPFLKSEA